MQQAKKLVLLDEFGREYKRLQRPADTVAKTNRSLQLSDTLRESSLDDDCKVREYVAALHKYLNVHKEVPSQPVSSVNPLTEPPAPPAPPVHKRSRNRSPRAIGPARKRQKRVMWSQY